MGSPTPEQAAYGWRNLSTMPKHGQECEVMGSDFMGEWRSQATFIITNPSGPKYKWKGMGFMGTRTRHIRRGDVELWRPAQEGLLKGGKVEVVLKGKPTPAPAAEEKE